jgi:hypothetical protein
VCTASRTVVVVVNIDVLVGGRVTISVSENEVTSVITLTLLASINYQTERTNVVTAVRTVAVVKEMLDLVLNAVTTNIEVEGVETKHEHALLICAATNLVANAGIGNKDFGNSSRFLRGSYVVTV